MEKKKYKRKQIDAVYFGCVSTIRIFFFLFLLLSSIGQKSKFDASKKQGISRTLTQNTRSLIRSSAHSHANNRTRKRNRIHSWSGRMLSLLSSSFTLTLFHFAIIFLFTSTTPTRVLFDLFFHSLCLACPFNSVHSICKSWFRIHKFQIKERQRVNEATPTNSKKRKKKTTRTETKEHVLTIHKEKLIQFLVEGFVLNSSSSMLLFCRGNSHLSFFFKLFNTKQKNETTQNIWRACCCCCCCLWQTAARTTKRKTCVRNWNWIGEKQNRHSYNVH